MAATHTLDIANSGDTIRVRLATSPNFIREYVPRSPTLSHVEFTPSALRDGGELPVTTRRNVTESARILFTGADAATVYGNIRTLELLLRRAEEWQRYRAGEPYYVKIIPGASGNGYRSEILSGRVEYSEAALSYQYTAAKIEATVIWTRRYYWELDAPTILTISNGSGTNTTLVITNNPAGNNYADIASDQVTGTIPTPAILLLDNTTNSATRSYGFYVGNNVFSTPASLTRVLQAESATINSGAAAADANASGGNRADLTVPNAETALCTWTISGNDLEYALGRYFRMLGRFAIESVALPVPFALRWQWKLGTDDAIWNGPEKIITTSASLRDLGLVQFPPGQIPSGQDQNNLSLRLLGRNTAGTGNITVRLDCVQLMPTDSYRALEPRVYGLDYQRVLADDPTIGMLYQYVTGTGLSAIAIYNATGQPVMLWPGVAQRLTILVSQSDNQSAIARTTTLQVQCRPRRLTL